MSLGIVSIIGLLLVRCELFLSSAGSDARIILL